MTIFDDDLTAESLNWRPNCAANLRVEVYPDSLKGGKNLGKAFKYADSRQARFERARQGTSLDRGELRSRT